MSTLRSNISSIQEGINRERIAHERDPQTSSEISNSGMRANPICKIHAAEHAFWSWKEIALSHGGFLEAKVINISIHLLPTLSTIIDTSIFLPNYPYLCLVITPIEVNDASSSDGSALLREGIFVRVGDGLEGVVIGNISDDGKQFHILSSQNPSTISQINDDDTKENEEEEGITGILFRDDLDNSQDLAYRASVEIGDHFMKRTAQFIQGRVHQKRGDFRTALTLYSASRGEGGKMGWLSGFGIMQCHLGLDDGDSALQQARDLLSQLNQESFREVSGYSLLLEAMVTNSPLPPLHEEYKRMTAHFVHSFDMWCQIAESHQNSPHHSPQTALEAYQMAVEAHNESTTGESVDPHILVNMGVLYIQLRDLDEAARLLEEGVVGILNSSSNRRSEEDQQWIFSPLTTSGTSIFWEWALSPFVGSLSGSVLVLARETEDSSLRERDELEGVEGCQVRLGRNMVFTIVDKERDVIEGEDGNIRGVRYTLEVQGYDRNEDGMNEEEEEPVAQAVFFKVMKFIPKPKKRSSEMLEEKEEEESSERDICLFSSYALRGVMNYGILREEMGDIESARQIYQSIILSFPSSLPTYLRLGSLEKKAGRSSVARELFSFVVTAFPGGIDGNFLLEDLHYKKGDYTLAIRGFKKISEKVLIDSKISFLYD